MARRRSKSGISVKRPGAFRRWLGKSPGASVTGSDIAKGLKSKNPRVRQMANFARNARGWNKGGGGKSSHRVRSHTRTTASGKRVRVKAHRRSR